MPEKSAWPCFMGSTEPIGASAALGSSDSHADLRTEQLSEGERHKWEVVSNQSMYDFVSYGFELNSVAYEKRDQTSYYWCYKLAKAHSAQ
jgi:hypothetical protein